MIGQSASARSTIHCEEELRMRRYILALPLLISLAGPAHADVGTIAATASISSLITQIINGLSELISEAEASATTTGFAFATSANILLQNMEVLGKELSGQVFKDLNSTQQATLQNTLLVIDRANRDIASQVDAINTLTASVGQEISRIPGVSKRPLLVSYTPSYVLNKDDSYDLRLRGSLLNSDRSTLYFGSTPCTLVTSIETEVRFSCPATAFDAATNKWSTGLLVLEKPKAWWKFWESREEYRYKLGMMVVQREMGDYRLRRYENSTVTTRVSRKQENEAGNGHCQGDRHPVWTYNPAANCKVEETTVSVEHRTSANSRYDGVINLSANGFQVRGVVSNSGDCGPHEVWVDARGKLWVRAHWTDLCPTVKENELPEESGTLSWTEEKAFQLPSESSKFLLEIKQKDGSVKVFDKAGASSWFTLEYDPNSKVVMFKPRLVADAFR
jgi:hypothetical protein